MNRSNKVIRSEIKATKLALSTTPRDDKWKELSNAARQAQEALRRHTEILDRNDKPRRDQLWSKLSELQRELKATQNKYPVAALPEVLQKWLRKLGHGIEHSNQWRIVWHSEDCKYAVVKLPGRTYWSGIGFRNYGSTGHELWDTTKSDHWTRSSGARLAEHTGRFSKAVLKNWQNLIKSHD